MGGSDWRSSLRDGSDAVPTKTGLAGQASGNRRQRPAVLGVALAVVLCLAACRDHVDEGKDCPPSARATTLSGYCVPRYVSLKRATVNARKGPGVDYPILWIYHAKGLPVQVVAETADWRRVCDPDGGAVWIQRAMVDGRRTVRALGPDALPVLRAPQAGAPVLGLLNAHAVADLDHCEGGWCQVRVGAARGWVTAMGVWGTAAAPQCR